MAKKPTNEEIVLHLSNGLTVSKIADKLKMNPRSLEARLVRLKDKNGCLNSPQLVAFFLRNKLIK